MLAMINKWRWKKNCLIEETILKTLKFYCIFVYSIVNSGNAWNRKNRHRCNILRNCKMFSIKTTSFYILQTMYKGSDFFISLLTLVIIFLMIVILVGVKWYIIVVMIMSNDEHLSMSLLELCVSFLAKCLFGPFVHF